MDSDQVLVMDAGQAVEFGPPHELLQNPDGYFTKMLKETGKNMESKLRKVAEEYYRRNSPASETPALKETDQNDNKMND